jgi:peroxiredoxin Q/BCP
MSPNADRRAGKTVTKTAAHESRPTKPRKPTKPTTPKESAPTRAASPSKRSGPARPQPIEIGTAAPEFAAKDGRGRMHRLADLRGSWVALFFYPKDSSSACTEEMCDVQARRADFRSLGATAFGISPDTARSHAAFAEAHGLAFPLLVDEKGEDAPPPIASAYGVWGEKSMYGRTYMGTIRTTFLIDPKGRVAERWDAVKVKGHVDAVLARLRELSAR